MSGISDLAERCIFVVKLWITHEKIDLIIDRRDHVINLCEMKFSLHPYVIDKQYAADLREKIAVFKAATGTTKSIFLTFISSFGLTRNEYSGSLVQATITMYAFFDSKL